MAIAALAVPGLGTIGVGGIIAVGLGGAMLGTYLGVGAASDEWDQHERLRETALEPGQILLAVCARDRSAHVAHVLTEHGGTVLERT